MANQMVVRLANVKRYEFEGRSGATVTIMDQIAQGNENASGIDFSQMSAEYHVFEQFQNLDIQPPCNVEVDVDIRMTRSSSGKQVTSLHVLGMRTPMGGGNSAGSTSANSHSRSGADAAEKAKATT